MRPGSPSASRRESGTTLLEILTVLSIAAILLTVSVPSLVGAYRRQQLSSAVAGVRGVVQYTRLKAVKEKVDHRIVIHDVDAISPNRVDVEQRQGGGFVVLDELTFELPDGVKILGSSPMDSMDTSEVTRRGHCDGGSVYLQDLEGNVQVIEIKSSCFAGVSS